MIPADNDDLDLPPLDGESDGAAARVDDDDLDLTDADGDALDDRTMEDAPHDEVHADGAEAGWLEGSEDAATLDVGAFEVVIAAEGTVLDDEEPVALSADDELGDDERPVVDGGEEGPLDDDEELREEDLPALDADEDGDVDDALLFERAALEESEGEELRWDDRAWARVDSPARADEPDESGVLAIPSDEPTESARDLAWKRLETTGRVSAAAFVPGDSIVVALMTSDHSRALLVRIQPDGAALIIAEVSEDEPRVNHLRWDAARGTLVAIGPFGTHCFRPAL